MNTEMHNSAQLLIRTTPQLRETLQRLAATFKISVNELCNNMFRNMAATAGVRIERSYPTKMVAAKLAVHPNTVKGWIKKHPEWKIVNKGKPGMRIPHSTLQQMLDNRTKQQS